LGRRTVTSRAPLRLQVAAEEGTTSGGLVLPSSAVSKPMAGEVVAVGDGYNAKTGKTRALDVAAGERVVYSKFAGTEVAPGGVEHVLLKADDVIGTLQGDDISRLQPAGDRVLLAKAAATAATSGGVLLAGSGTGSVPLGRVVAVGPGLRDEEGVRHALTLPVGATVLYTLYAGVEFEAAKGDAASGYVVVRADEVVVTLAK